MAPDVLAVTCANLTGKEGFIRYRIDRHDRSQLELKLDYPLRPGVREQAYTVETFLFIPRVLGLTKNNYSSSDFYGDSVSFLRMTTPQRQLTELTEKSTIKAWTGDIKSEIAALTGGNSEDSKLAEHNIRLIGCVYKGALRTARDELVDAIRRESESSSVGFFESVDQFVEDVQGAVRRLRKLGKKLSSTELPASLNESWWAVDEYVSLLAEETCTQALIELDRLDKREGLESRQETLRAIAVSEYHYRRKQGWETYADPSGSNEYLAHRWRVLKRFVSGVLYVDVDREEVGLLARDIAGVIAAAMAMLVATLAILFINEHWPANLSWAFVSAMVAMYVVKDRVKEWGRRGLGDRLTQNQADHVLKIRSPVTGDLLGSCSEDLRVGRTQDVASEVLEIRNRNLSGHEQIHGRPETVICHTKNIRLSSEALSSSFAGAEGITDVQRLNIARLLHRMDDPWESYNFVHPTQGTIESTRCRRVYHVNVILRLSTPDGFSQMERCRAVLNKKGLLRIELFNEDNEPSVVSSAAGSMLEELPAVDIGEDFD